MAKLEKRSKLLARLNAAEPGSDEWHELLEKLHERDDVDFDADELGLDPEGDYDA